jgi:2-polyprenyl-3-methyl-5-hydroxy-6-metoxy-1,4-benzoquinol methylase
MAKIDPQNRPSENKIPPGKIAYETIKCSLCGGKYHKIKFQIDLITKTNNTIRINDIDYLIDSQETIVECQTCGLIFVNPRILMQPGRRIVSNQDEKLYFEDTRKERIVVYSNLIEQLPKWFGKNPENLLDFGCGDGVLLEAALKEGIACTGIEMDDELVTNARKRLHGSYRIEKSLSSVPESSCDVITLINVVEHLTDPAGILLDLSKILRPDGILLIHTPNVNSVQSRILRSRWHHYEPLVHFYYFNNRTLRRMVENTGMCVVGHFNITSPQSIKTSLQNFLLKLGFFMGNGFGIIAQCQP